jgi:hypothetical protein
MSGLTREGSGRIGFVILCVTLGAISFAEFKLWLEHIMVTEPDYPLYIIELYEAAPPLNEADRIVGFVGDGPERKSEWDTLDQLAFDRNGFENDNVTSLHKPKYACEKTLARFNQEFFFLPDVPVQPERKLKAG